MNPRVRNGVRYRALTLRSPCLNVSYCATCRRFVRDHSPTAQGSHHTHHRTSSTAPTATTPTLRDSRHGAPFTPTPSTTTTSATPTHSTPATTLASHPLPANTTTTTTTPAVAGKEPNSTPPVSSDLIPATVPTQEAEITTPTPTPEVETTTPSLIPDPETTTTTTTTPSLTTTQETEPVPCRRRTEVVRISDSGDREGAFSEEKESRESAKNSSAESSRSERRGVVKEKKKEKNWKAEEEKEEGVLLEEGQGKKTPVDYEAIEDIEELRQLLYGTFDFEEKRKIRSCMRKLRQLGEIEKIGRTETATPKSSTGHKDKNTTSTRSTTTTVKPTPSSSSSLPLDTAAERPSEDRDRVKVIVGSSNNNPPITSKERRFSGDSNWIKPKSTNSLSLIPRSSERRSSVDLDRLKAKFSSSASLSRLDERRSSLTGSVSDQLKTGSSTVLPKPAKETTSGDQDRVKSRSSISSSEERSSREIPWEQDSISAIAYTPFERRSSEKSSAPSSSSQRGRDYLSSLVRDKVQAALRERLHRVTPISAWGIASSSPQSIGQGDTPSVRTNHQQREKENDEDEERKLEDLVTQKLQEALRERLQTSPSVRALSQSQGKDRFRWSSEAERKQEEEQLSVLVNEKVQEALKIKLRPSDGETQERLSGEQSDARSVLKRPQGISGSKSWVESLRSRDVLKPSVTSTESTVQTERYRRSSVEGRKTGLEKPDRARDESGSEDSSRESSGLKDKSHYREDPFAKFLATGKSGERGTSLRRLSNSQSAVHSSEAAKSSTHPRQGRRSSSPHLRRPSTSSLTDQELVQGSKGHCESLRGRRGSSPVLSDRRLLEKTSTRLQNRRPSSPLGSGGNRRSSLTSRFLTNSGENSGERLPENRAAEPAGVSVKSEKASRKWEDTLNVDLLHTVKERLQARRKSLHSPDQDKSIAEPENPREGPNKVDEAKEHKHKENRRLSETGTFEGKSTEQSITCEPHNAARTASKSQNKDRDANEATANTSVNKSTEKPSDTGQRFIRPLTDFDKLERGLKPSVSKNLVSSLAGKFSATDTPSSAPLKELAAPDTKEPLPSSQSASRENNTLKKTESLRDTLQVKNTDREQRSHAPARAETFNAQDTQKKPGGLKREVTLFEEKTEQKDNIKESDSKSAGKLSTTNSDHLQPSHLNNASQASGTNKTTDIRDKELLSKREGVQTKKSKFQETVAAKQSAKMSKSPRAVSLTCTDNSQSGGSDGGLSVEKAFSALLDDMDLISASEGTASDIDLSDGDEVDMVEQPPLSNETAGQHLETKLNNDNKNLVKTSSANNSPRAGFSVKVSSPSYAVQKRKSSLNRKSEAPGLIPLTEDLGESHVLASSSTKEDGKLYNKMQERGDKEEEVEEEEEQEEDVFDYADTAGAQALKTFSETTPRQHDDDVEVDENKEDNDLTRSSPTTSHHNYTKDQSLAKNTTQSLQTLKKDSLTTTQPTIQIQTPDTKDEATIGVSSKQHAFTPSNTERSMTVLKDEDGGVIYRKVSKDEREHRVTTIRSKHRHTSDDASEDIRDVTLETNFLSPEGGAAAVVQERDVFRSRRKVTSGGSNYYVRTAERTRRVRDDVSGSDFVEHDVTVESDNTSVKEGRSWGSKTVTKAQVTLDKDPNSGDREDLLPLDELCSLPQLEMAGAGGTGGGRRAAGGSTINTATGATPTIFKMDMSKASSGYGSVSGSEEEDKDVLSPTTATAAAGLDLRSARRVGAPEILNTLKEVTSVEGQVAVLECTLIGHPAPDVTWFYDDVKVDLSTDRVTGHFDTASGKAALTFHEVAMGDRGMYTCTCTNHFGESSTKAALIVKQKPTDKPFFEEPLRDVTVVEDHSVTLQCVVTSATTVAWYKDGIVQRNSSDFRQTFDGRVARLEIGEVFMDDVGKYSCVARNEKGEERSSCTLRVTATGSSSDSEMVPTFLTKLPPHKTVVAGQDLSLEVEVIGNPDPEVGWRRDGVDLPADSLQFSCHYDGRLARLRVCGMEMEEEGVFECLACNKAGQACVDVRVTVQKRNKAPSFTSPLQDLTAPLGSSVTMDCTVSGTPNPSVFWRRNGLIVADTPDFKHCLQEGRATLTVTEVRHKHGGVYECVAKNEAGNAVCSCQLLVLDPPDDEEHKEETEKETVPTSPRDFADQTSENVMAPDAENGPEREKAPEIQRTAQTDITQSESESPRNDRTRFSRRDRHSPEPSTGVRLTHKASPRSLLREDSAASRASPRAGDFSQLAASSSRKKKEEDSLSASSDSTRDRIREKHSDGGVPQTEAKDRIAKFSDNGSDMYGASAAGTKDVERNVDGPKVSVKNGEIISEQVVTDSEKSPRTDKGQLSNRDNVQRTDKTPTNMGLKKRSTNSEEATRKDNDTCKALEHSDKKRDTKMSSIAEVLEKSSGTSEVSCSPRSARGKAGDAFRQMSSSSQDHTDSASVVRKSSVPEKRESTPPTGARRKISEPPQTTIRRPNWESGRTSVSQLKARFSNIEEDGGAEKTSGGGGGGRGALGGGSKNEGGGGGEKRSSSLPSPRDVKRGTSSKLPADDKASPSHATSGSPPSATTTTTTTTTNNSSSSSSVTTHTNSNCSNSTTTSAMSSYDHIDDEEELHKLMNSTESFEERKKIRTRLRDIREKQRVEMEARRQQREKETEDLVRRKFEMADEEKRRKLKAYGSQKPFCERDTDYQATAQKMITDRHRLADQEKAKKLEAYRNIAHREHQADDGRTTTRVTTATFRNTDGSGGVTKKTETTTSVPQTMGFGGVQYGAPRPQQALNARQLKEQLRNAGGPNTRGSVTVKTQSWSSRDGVVNKSHKTETWGAKPQGSGPRGAMAAFKQMDASNPGPKPNKPTMARSPSSIKQILLDWCKIHTREYENVEVTNFSSSWNNGMAFCALIHHFFPDAFDFKQLDPKNRRYNFDLAFNTAEKMADIMPLLDTEDMVCMKNPDWKCVFTYVQAIYRHLRDHDRNLAKPAPPPPRS